MFCVFCHRCMPLDEMRQKAKNRLEQMSSDGQPPKDLGVQDLLILELLDWFKVYRINVFEIFNTCLHAFQSLNLIIYI